MTYSSLRACVDDLAKHQALVSIDSPVDPNLEIAAIQLRLYKKRAPAVLFRNVKGTKFPVLINLFGTPERAKFIFRNSWHGVKAVIQAKANPPSILGRPHVWPAMMKTALHALPVPAWQSPVLKNKTSIDALPQIKCWPDDGGAFITLPQVYTEHPSQPGLMQSNVGMYRVQLGGNQYQQNKQIGLHYQIHRSIGIHHAAAAKKGEKLRVAIFVGGPPAHTLAAVMPLPEGLAEVLFAGMLANRNVRTGRFSGHRIFSESDFCILGSIDPQTTLPEGPFGDHLGYYSLKHPFPVMQVEHVLHRDDAIWPCTVVGRPPQEDTTFGKVIHELTEPMVPVSLPGVSALHAIDAAGVHPLLLAIGSERYAPYEEESAPPPQELLTQANAILGFNQCSLAKYLIIAAAESWPLDINEVKGFFSYVLERINLRRDLHFQTQTTMDTLDYSGTGLNSGSKLVMAARGKPIRKLATVLPPSLRLPAGWRNPQFVNPGILAVEANAFGNYASAIDEWQRWCEELKTNSEHLTSVPMIVLVDDAKFCARAFDNFLWVTFTRSNPSHDTYGVGSTAHFKHWSCSEPLCIDARLKPHHAPPLIENSEIAARADEFVAKHFPN